MQYTIAIVGMGTIWKLCAKAVLSHPNLQLVWYADTSIDKIENSTIPLFDDYRKLIVDIAPDCVIITTPNGIHEDIIQYAIEHKIHVACEKPLTTNYNKVSYLIDKAYNNQLILKTIYHRSYNKNLLDNRPNKEIKKISMRYKENIFDHTTSGWFNNREISGGGCLIDNGTNVFDVVLRLVGDVVIDEANLTYKSADVLAENIESAAHITLTASKTGALVDIELDRLYTGEQKDIQIWYHDNTSEYIDFLDWYEMFKSSLDHEYRWFMDDLYHRMHTKNIEKDILTIKNMALIEKIYSWKNSK